MLYLNKGQELVVNKAVEWFYHSDEQLFQFDGPPGSGKSFVLMEIVKRLGLDIASEVAPMSFIGSASLVMRNKGLFSARTAHSWLFDVKDVYKKDKDGNLIMDTLLDVPIKVAKFIPVSVLDPDIKLIIVDEAYSMPRSLRPEIEKFGIKIIACGDQNQLPPVKDYPAFLVDGKIYHLTEIMRQQGLDDINFIANRVMHGFPINNGYYGNSLVINKEDITEDMLMWADCIICGRNLTRDAINSKIREILGYHSPSPYRGEKLVCRNNNWNESVELSKGIELNLVNGLIGTVNNNPNDGCMLESEQICIDFIPDLSPGVMFKKIKCNYDHIVSDYVTRNHIRQNKYSKGNMLEYAYCITAHIAQGSQFHKVLYIEEPMRKNIQNSINLVGATRADQMLIYAH